MALFLQTFITSYRVEGRERLHSQVEAGQESRDRLGSADTGYGTGRAEEEQQEEEQQEKGVSPRSSGDSTQHTEL